MAYPGLLCTRTQTSCCNLGCSRLAARHRKEFQRSALLALRTMRKRARFLWINLPEREEMEDYWKPLILQLRRSTLRFRFASATLKGLLRPAVWSGLAAGSGRERTHLTQNNKTTPHELPRPAQSNGQHVLHFAVPRLHGFSELARAVIFLGLRLQIFSFRIAPMQPGPGSVHVGVLLEEFIRKVHRVLALLPSAFEHRISPDATQRASNFDPTLCTSLHVHSTVLQQGSCSRIRDSVL